MIPGNIGITAEERSKLALLGDVGSVVGPDAPPGFPPDLTAGFVSLITDLNGKVNASAIKAGTLTVNGGATSGSDDTETGWNGNPVLAVPNGDTGAVRWWVGLSNGVVTVTTSAALAGPVVFSYVVLNLGG